jgi:TonB family protein
LAGVTLTPLRAQHILLTLVDGRILPIQAVRGAVPYVKIDGRLRPANGGGAILHPAPLYRDGFVRLEDFEIKTFSERISLDTLSAGSQSSGNINNTLTLTGRLTATQPLDNCFLVFEMTAGPGHPAEMGTVELPNLAANERRSFRATLTLGAKPEADRYRVHIFSGRWECRISRGDIPPDRYADTQAWYLERTAKAVPDPTLIVSPAYPKGLVGGNVSGRATIHCRIGAEGDVLESVVLRADRPEFGEAANAAVRQWLFRPAVVDHRFVEATVDIPVFFPAPGGAG